MQIYEINIFKIYLLATMHPVKCIVAAGGKIKDKVINCMQILKTRFNPTIPIYQNISCNQSEGAFQIKFV